MFLSFGAVNGGENFFFERAKRLVRVVHISLVFGGLDAVVVAGSC